MSSELLKAGTQVFQGLDAILKNIDAVKELSKITRTSMGPNGMNKMVVNRVGKLFVTNDAATILKEIEVVHPAAKICVNATEQQQQEFGDGTNFVLVLSGELLSQAQTLLRMGLHASDIIRGFEKSGALVPAILDNLVPSAAKIVPGENGLMPADLVAKAIRGAIGSKMSSFVDVFAPLVAAACLQVTPKDPTRFNIDNVRTAKIMGGAVGDASVIKGMAITRGAEGTIKRVNKAKVAVYADGITTAKTDAKGTVFIEKASELESYTRSEEDSMERNIKDLADAGVNLVIVGGTVHEMAMHFLERYKIMVVKTPSKFELRRVCQAIKAEPLVRIAPPTPEQMGYVDECFVHEIGSTQVTILLQEHDSAIATIVIRGATQNILDDVERSMDDGLNVYKALVKDGRFVPGASAAETEIARQVRKVGESTPGQDQYAIKKFAEAFEVVGRTLAENAGIDAQVVLSTLYARHEAGEVKSGVNVVSGKVEETGIWDHLATKENAIRLATDAAITVLKISQIIMAKQAGVNVPAQRQGGTMGAMDQDDEM